MAHRSTVNPKTDKRVFTNTAKKPKNQHQPETEPGRHPPVKWAF